MCIYNFTDSLVFSKIIEKHPINFHTQAVIGCLIFSDRLGHVMSIRKKYSFVVIHTYKHGLEYYVLKSCDRINKKNSLEMLDSFEEYVSEQVPNIVR